MPTIRFFKYRLKIGGKRASEGISQKKDMLIKYSLWIHRYIWFRGTRNLRFCFPIKEEVIP